MLLQKIGSRPPTTHATSYFSTIFVFGSLVYGPTAVEAGSDLVSLLFVAMELKRLGARILPPRPAPPRRPRLVRNH